jgi:hypothetical protein
VKKLAVIVFHFISTTFVKTEIIFLLEIARHHYPAKDTSADNAENHGDISAETEYEL